MTTPLDPWLPLHTERLILRDFREDDVDDIHAYGSDPRVARFMDWGPNSLEDTRIFLERRLVDQATTPRVEFGLAIEHAAQGRVIGAIGLHPFDPRNAARAVGYCLHHDAWGQGIALEAARAVIGAAIAALDLHRVIATCDVANVASFRVMEKLGMRREGCFRRDRLIKGDWRDTYLYAVLAADWAPDCP